MYENQQITMGGGGAIESPISQASKPKKRIEYIDIAKGICIILVAMNHYGLTLEGQMGIMLQSFRMPLYFILSGLFFSKYSGFKEFTVKKINKLLIPFLSFLLFSFIIFLAIHIVKHDEIGYVFFDKIYSKDVVMYDGPIWFLICLFFCGILFYVVTIISGKFKKPLLILIILSLLIGCCGYFLGKNNINIPLWVDTAMTALPFYAFGYILRNYTAFLIKQISYRISLPLCVILLGITYFFASPIGMWINFVIKSNIITFYLCGTLGTLAILLLSQCLDKLKKFYTIKLVSYYGRYSICILVTHKLILGTISNITHFEVTGKIFIFIIIMASYLLIIPFMIKFTPHICAQKDVIKYQRR
ncbi:MAG: acyltransferase [Bacteroidaceae bacterium]|nr:acyltransferase [Bacteroidaceae bacterium]